MTMEEYLSNPMGKGSAVPMSGQIKSALDTQYNELRSKIICNWYLYKEDSLVAVLKIPSRSVDLFYDVIVEFDLKSIPEEKNLTNFCNFRVFSNCPSFVFTYAYTFYKKNLLCKWAMSKYSNEVLSQSPDIRNQYQIINFERSLYFAFKYLSGYGRNNIRNLKSTAAKEDNYTTMLRWVVTSDEILERYRYEKDKERRKKEKNSKREKVPIKKIEKGDFRDRTKNSNKVNKTKSAKKIKKTKKI